MKRKIKKAAKKIVAASLCLVMVMYVVLPVTKILAEESYAKLSVSFDNYSISDATIEYKNTSGKWIKVSTNISNVEALAVRIYNVRDGYSLANHSVLTKDGNKQDINNIFAPNGIALEGDANYALEHIEFISSAQGPEPGQSGNTFDGKAYFAWDCDGNLCYHKFNSLVGGGAEGYQVNYIALSSLTDESVNNKAFTMDNKLYGWILAKDLEDETGSLKYNTVLKVLGDGRDNHGVTLDPCGAENGNNTISTNGGMNFRATIYDDTKYEGIEFDVSKANSTYFPGFYDSVFNNNAVDISETTKANPAKFDVYLLNDSITFDLNNKSIKNISKVEVLDIENNAVAVTKLATNKYKVTFKSNYYDNVILKITDAASNDYYVRIVRTTMQVSDNFGPTTTNPEVRALVYYPSTYSYNDFEVIAKIVNSDGTTETKLAQPSNIGFMNGQTINSPENGDAGKGLKAGNYSVKVTDDVSNVYFTVIHKGTNNDSFAGAFAGSGKGLNFDIEEREIVFE